MPPLPPAGLTAALEYLRRGWSPLPLCPADHEGVPGAHERSCRRPGKEPVCDWSAYRRRRAGDKELRLWWARYPRAGVGIALGPVSGLAGVDVGGTAGEARLARVSAGELPATLEFITRGGGRRLLYLLPAGSAEREVAEAGDEDLRVLGYGRHTVLPPTPGYAWVAGHGPGEIMAAPCPGWLLRALGLAGKSPGKSPGQAPGQAPASPSAAAPAESAVAPESAAGPVVWTAAELMGEQLRELRWAVPGLVPEGGTILAGRPKTGKSWLTLGLALAVAGGRPALGALEAARGEVLYLALEDGPRRLRRRLERLLGGGEVPGGLHLATAWPRAGEGGLARLQAWLHGHPQARLVVVDTLARVRDRPAEVGYEDDYRALAALKDVGDRHGVSVLVVHHTRKGNASDPLELVSGTLGLTGAADCALVLRHPRYSDEGRLFVTGRDVDERELLLAWDRRRCLWLLDEEADGLTREQREVLAALAGLGRPAGPLEVARLLNKGHAAVKQLLRRMADEHGLVRRAERPRGSYEVVPGNGQ